MKISERRYDYGFTPVSEFSVGNPNMLIHELRIKSTPSTIREVRETYARGIPFSANDLVLDQHLEVGQTVDLITSLDTDQATVVQPPFIVRQPSSKTVPFATKISLDVASSASDCRYASFPMLFEDMSPLIRRSTSHSGAIPVSDIVDPYLLSVKCSDDYSYFDRIRVLPEINNDYPKLFNIFWGATITPNIMENISRFDMVGIAASYIYKSDLIRGSKQYHDFSMFAFYDNLIAISPHHGYYETDLYGLIGDKYRLQNSEGVFAYNPSFERNYMQNLYLQGYQEAQADQADYMMSYGYFDQIWHDNAGSSFWFLVNYSAPGTPYVIYPDIDRDGVDENLDDSVDRARAQGYWKEGIRNITLFTRERFGPQSIITGNAVDYMPEDWNGKLWEEEMSRTEYGLTLDDFLDTPTDDPYAMRHNFLFWQNHTQAPKVNQNLYGNDYVYGSTYFYKSHRYGLAASLIGGVYYGTAPRANRVFVWWFDEYWVDVLSGEPTLDASGRGWLGEPIALPVKVSDDVYYREFERGIAVASTVSTTVDLPTTFRRISGHDDAINDGSLVSSITLSGKDGAVLIRARCDNNPGEDPLCIPVGCGIPYDTNCDQFVNFQDLTYAVNHYGQKVPGITGVVDLRNLVLLARSI